ncbi:MAG: STAS domain-containing protein [Tissierellia bacterium]|nr:STAS domain-containing protein [Tissierellia bacterium]
MFNIDFQENGELVVSLSGDLDINTVKQFQDEVLKNYSQVDKDFVFDLKDLDYIDSTGLGAIITVYKEVNDKGYKLRVINAKKNVRKLFFITELDSLFEIGE